MKNILYVCIMFLGIMSFACCGAGSSSKALLARADSLLKSRPDSALKLLNSIEREDNLSEEQQIQLIWNRAQAHYRLGLAMTEDTLLPRALDYYRQRGDSDKLLESYLLEACYWRWSKQEERMAAALDGGLNRAIALKDTSGIIAFYRGKWEICSLHNDHAGGIEQMKKLMQYSDGMFRESVIMK